MNEHVFPISNVDFPASHVSELRGVMAGSQTMGGCLCRCFSFSNQIVSGSMLVSGVQVDMA